MRHLLLLLGFCLATNAFSQVDLTLQVNMSNETVGPNGVHVAGNFQGWDPAGTPLTDNGNGIYSVTISVAEGTYFYKFINGNDWPQAESVPASCGVSDGFGGFNRSVAVGSGGSIIDPVCFGECLNCDLIVEQPTNLITFKVNMQDQVVSPDGVHITGNFQGWNPASTMMTDADSDGIYEYTLEADEWANLSFKFINGNTFTVAEQVPSQCGLPDGFGEFNRILETGSNDFVMSPVCFGSCTDCESIVEPTFVNVTFAVNMQDETVSANGVHIAGSFQNFDPAASEMTDVDADGIYTFTASIESGTTIQYTFINGNSFDNQESVPSTCGVSNGFGGFNRSLVVADADMTLDAVCFSACVDCEAIVEPTLVDVTFNVNMQNEIVSISGVHIAGSFQGWNPSSAQMTDIDGDGIYSYTAQIEENTDVQFVFINGNSFDNQEAVPAECGVSNGFGGFNRSYNTGDTESSFGPVCFGECTNCAPIVDPETVQVAFRVNMQNETVEASGVFIAGTPFGEHQMTALGNNVYQWIGEFEPGTNLSYRYLNGSVAEVVPVDCGVNDGSGIFERSVIAADIATTLDPVCFGGCDDCEPILPALVTVVFQVDMSNVTVSPQGVHLAGSFQGWNANGSMMTSLGGGVYEQSFQIEANQTVQFKFINGNTFNESEIVPAACGVDDGFGGMNRSLIIGSENLVFGPVCFSACEACDDIVEPTTVSVTFQVDMSNETVSPDGVHIAGNFQGWNPSTTEMTNVGANIYQYVAQIPVNTSIAFRFVNGNDWPFSEVNSAACGVPDGFGNFNRTLDVASSAVTFGPVCFNQCTACLPSVPVLVTFRVDMSNEIISPDGVFITGQFNNWDPEATQMSSYGPGLYQAVVVLNAGQTTQYKFLNGPDFAGIEIVPSECGADDGAGNINRSYTAGSGNETLDAVCFSQCGACVLVNTVNVTFQVDMSQQTVEPSGVWLAGTFNNFNPTATAMTDNGVGVYTVTLALPENTQQTFKYLNGAIWETVPFACGFDDGFGGFNRQVNVASTGFSIPEVCFSDCVDCPVSVNELDNMSFISLYPNPADNVLNIISDSSVISNVLVVDMQGKVVLSYSTGSTHIMQLNIENLSSGLYQLVIPGMGSKSFVIQ